MTIQTESELLAALADNQTRDIDAAKLRDVVESIMAVGGTMYCDDEPIALTGAWQPFSAFTQSIDTKGLNESFSDGHFTVGAGAGGVYTVAAKVNLTAPGPGTIMIAVTKNGALTPFRDSLTFATGEDKSLVVFGSGSLADGDTVGLAIDSSAAATVNIDFAQFRVSRN